MGPRRLLIDEGVPACIGERLRQDGHTIILAQEIGKVVSDEALIAYALRERAIVVTRDYGLARRVVWRELPVAVVFWLSLDGIPRDKQPEVVARWLPNVSGWPGLHRIGGYSSVLSPEIINRWRNLPKSE